MYPDHTLFEARSYISSPFPPRPAMNDIRKLSVAVVITTLLACGDAPPAETDADADGDAPIGTVTITQPASGSQVMAGNVTVSLQVAGFPIVPAGNMTSGTGHHHLYLDADLTGVGEPVPTVPGSIIHMGDGSSEYTFEDVAPGEHRLIAVVADGIHTPLQPWVVDTVTFTVN
jgi:hypothetical protein